MDISCPQWASESEWIDWCNNTPIGVLKRSAELEAEVQRLREAVQVLKDNTFTVPGMVCHKMVGESELFAVFEAALLREEDSE